MFELIAAVALIASGSLPATAAVAENQRPDEDCFDVAVVVTAPVYWPLPFKEEPDEIVMQAPYLISFDVEQSLAGSDPGDTITIKKGLHQHYWSSTGHRLLFLRRREKGYYGLAGLGGLGITVLEETSGDFVVPITGPVKAEMIEPDGVFPPDYREKMRSINYSRDQALGFNFSHMSDEEIAQVRTKHPWASVKRDRIVATRGLPVDALVRALATRRCQQKVG